jgi:hypothetical protein
MTTSIQSYDYDFMNVFLPTIRGVREANLHNYKYQLMFTPPLSTCRIVKVREISVPAPDVTTTELRQYYV